MPQPAAPQFTDAEAVREGSRWINGRPDSTQFSDWFTNNVLLHEDMEHEKYVGGIVLISGREKHKVARVAANGAQTFIEEDRLVHTPYAKVETRVAYFWDYLASKPEWVGSIEPGPITGGAAPGLPPGFFRMEFTRTDAKVVRYVCCSMQVRILKADSVKSIDVQEGNPRMGLQRSTRIEGTPVAAFPAATKMIPALGSGGNEDPFALMKAETGAVGRALGMAGMLIIPGSGVATAEDMIEAQQHTPGSGGIDAALAQDIAAEAADTPAPADPRAEIADMIARLESENPEAMAEIREWAVERKLTLSELSDTALRGVRRRLAAALGE